MSDTLGTVVESDTLMPSLGINEIAVSFYRF